MKHSTPIGKYTDIERAASDWKNSMVQEEWFRLQEKSVPSFSNDMTADIW